MSKLNLMPFGKMFKQGNEEIIAFAVSNAGINGIQIVWNDGGSVRTEVITLGKSVTRDEHYNQLMKETFQTMKNKINGVPAFPTKPTGSKRIS